MLPAVLYASRADGPLLMVLHTVWMGLGLRSKSLQHEAHLSLSLAMCARLPFSWRRLGLGVHGQPATYMPAVGAWVGLVGGQGSGWPVLTKVPNSAGS